MSLRMAKPPKKPWRPKVEIDWAKVDQMIVEGCNGAQVAAAIGACADTIYRACEREKGVTFAAYYQDKRSLGDNYLHRTQYHKAVKEKNVTMLIHLGKHRLGQIEKVDNKDSTPPQDVVIEKDNENMSLKAQLDKLQAQIDNLTKAKYQLPGSDSPV
jgi:hypothetical protein